MRHGTVQLSLEKTASIRTCRAALRFFLQHAGTAGLSLTNHRERWLRTRKRYLVARSHAPHFYRLSAAPNARSWQILLQKSNVIQAICLKRLLNEGFTPILTMISGGTPASGAAFVAALSKARFGRASPGGPADRGAWPACALARLVRCSSVPCRWRRAVRRSFGFDADACRCRVSSAIVGDRSNISAVKVARLFMATSFEMGRGCDRDRPSLGDSIIAQPASSCCAMGVTDGASVMRDTAFLREPIHAKSHATFDLNHLTIPSPIS
jgi:hypothetical protein